MERLVLMLLLVVAVGSDVWAFHSRCDLSPTVNLSALLLAFTMQAVGLLGPYLSYRHLGDSLTLSVRRRLLAMALLLVGSSIPVVH